MVHFHQIAFCCGYRFIYCPSSLPIRRLGIRCSAIISACPHHIPFDLCLWSVLFFKLKLGTYYSQILSLSHNCTVCVVIQSRTTFVNLKYLYLCVSSASKLSIYSLLDDHEHEQKIYQRGGDGGAHPAESKMRKSRTQAITSIIFFIS